MSIHLIIDGYNLIRASSELSLLDQQDIQIGRENLIDMLASYKKIKPFKITVVFDGINAPSYYQQRDHQKGIQIKFSRNGESADAVIKRMAEKEMEKAIIVSSDRDIINHVLSKGCSVIGSKEFENKLIMAQFSEFKEFEENDNQGWSPTTKKKGPSRRLSRKKRRNRSKINKL